MRWVQIERIRRCRMRIVTFEMGVVKLGESFFSCFLKKRMDFLGILVWFVGEFVLVEIRFDVVRSVVDFLWF